MSYGAGFAGGMQAGSQMVSRALQAKIDQENQEFLKKERADAEAFKTEIKAASATADVADQTGYRMVDPQGKAHFVPEADREYYSGVQTAEGKPLYTPGETVERYQEARAGGKLLGQGAYHPEAETGVNPGPAMGLAEDWNKNKMKRLEEIALRLDRPERALNYSQLTTQKLVQDTARAELELAPGKKTRQQQEIDKGTADAARQLIEDNAFKASRSEEAALKFKNDLSPDDGVITAETDPKTGMRVFMQVQPDGKTKLPIGEPYKTWDDGGRQQVLGEIPKFAAARYEADLKHKSETERDKAKHGYSMEEIAARGKWMLKNTGAMINGKKFDMTADEQEQVTKLTAEALESDDPKVRNAAQGKLHILTNKIAMRNGMQPRSFTGERPEGRNWGPNEQLAFENAKAKFIESQEDWGKLAPADRQIRLNEAGYGTRPGQRAAAGGGDRYTAGTGANKGEGGNGGGAGSQRGGLQTPKPDPFDQMIKPHRGGVTIKVPARSALSDLNGQTFGTRAEARWAIDKLRRAKGIAPDITEE